MKRSSKILVLLLVLCLALSTIVTASPGPAGDPGTWAGGCTDILVGKDATVDGSVIGTYSCDGAVYAKTAVVPAATYPAGTTIPIYYRPYPRNYNEAVANLAKEVKLGEIPQVAETYRYVSLLVYYDDQHCGGVNEHGLSIGETTIGGKKELRNPNGWLYAYSNYANTSLMTLALARAKTAREAVGIIGALAEEYGYAQSGEHLTISDPNEVWALEIFGAGAGWVPGSGKPGAVWAARKVPDGEVALSANSSRIGVIDPAAPADPDFLYSSNTFTLAQELGWWTPGTPFVWYKVYGNRANDAHSLREWSIVNKFAPSLGVEQTDPIFFSFKPDAKLSVQDVMNMYRDYLTGIPGLDATMHEAYKLPDGKVSPLASPFGPTELQKLLGVKVERSVATRSSVMTFVTQHKNWLPAPVGTTMWFTYGPAMTGLFAPLSAGTTELPEAWTVTPQTEVERGSAWWAYTMVDGLALIEWQNAMVDIKAVRDPAEANFLARQAAVEATAATLYANARGKSDPKGGKVAEKREEHGKRAAEAYLTAYTNESLSNVTATYWDLADYLLFKYYFRAGKSVPATLPAVPATATAN